MDIDKKTPNSNDFQRMSYSELKKVAKQHGIKGNMKAEKIIAALRLINSGDMDSFSTPPQKKINSSKQNKEDKFDEDKMTPLATPRRGTYSIESPESIKLDDSPASKTPFEMPILDISNVTICRGSERKLRPRKVNFTSPVRTPLSPRNQSIKCRPKTPKASRTPLGKRVSFFSPVKQVLIADEVNVATPFRLNIELAEKEDIASSVEQSHTDEVKSNATKSLISKDKIPVKIKRAATPNFKKIHEKAFEKMESIVDYQKRKAENSAVKICRLPNLKPKVTKVQSKIPAYTGIPFIVSIPGSTLPTLDQGSKPTKGLAPVVEKQKANNRQRNKAKFDLKASLSRKLGYKPYTGPLKPLAESNKLNTSTAACFHKPKEPVNKVVRENRLKSRSALRGVRTNKRFDLQMKNRKLE